MHLKTFTFIFILLPSLIFAQPVAVQKIAAKASESRLKRDLYALAGDRMEGRLMGSHGDTLAAKYVAANFRGAGVTAPYPNNSYFQTISAERFDDAEQLSFAGKNYVRFEGWQLFPNDSFKTAGIHVLVNKYRSIEEWNKYLPTLDVSGKAILFTDILFKQMNRVDSLEKALVGRGAVLVIWSGPKAASMVRFRNETAFLPLYRDPDTFVETGPIHEVALTPVMLQALVNNDHIKVDSNANLQLPANRNEFTLSAKLSVSRTRKQTTVKAPNVIGVITGTDPKAKVIILSAHHDHQGRNGKVTYYGAVDNASGSATIMEIVRLFKQARLAGFRPKRTIIIGSWTGEERGELGSFYYRDHPLIPVEKIFAVLNMDMLDELIPFMLKLPGPTAITPTFWLKTPCTGGCAMHFITPIKA